MNEQPQADEKINGDMPIPTIFDMWERHSRHLIPSSAGRMQLLMTRAAFLAGISATLHLFDQIAEKLSEEDGATAIAKLHEDADKFSADLLVDGIEYALNRAGARL
ncbi:hypothetical protein [Burkholderia sp. Ac-20365]|uniref:hypothetical protein n=1 Tax=Burkholderia sp. Ac-20365 TaxID=2703897 RepID=UPI00197C4037|nr:hypothetical protein [Burkholderia sp. Ac-20365]MBN3762452.1 hypothetical protein [Burkholderia sp. Ac-20365]